MEIPNAVYLQGSTSNAVSEEAASMETVLADTVVLMANEAMETTSTAATSEAGTETETASTVDIASIAETFSSLPFGLNPTTSGSVRKLVTGSASSSSQLLMRRLAQRVTTIYVAISQRGWNFNFMLRFKALKLTNDCYGRAPNECASWKSAYIDLHQKLTGKAAAAQENGVNRTHVSSFAFPETGRAKKRVEKRRKSVEEYYSPADPLSLPPFLVDEN
ncbi:hypothetical protein IV203_015361 [Nitzschia inconspicua]|uniref:Uncharacterized protein n=1 Tax=Nitzschia inconspicua TaxID=303405 RepID=A0A9K3LAZ8_9STRA|nr:hypothetical protein IV203_015361 [Nitzschia inconspicua]